MNKNKTLVINVFSGPGVGKSTACAGIFYEMKKQHYNVELVTEYAKEIVFENRQDLFTDQLYILAKQHRRILRLVDKVDYIITDSPIIQNLAYTPETYFESYNKLVYDVFNSFNNINFYLTRRTEYDPVGRYQNLEQAIELDKNIMNILDNHGISYFIIDNIENSLPDMLEVIKQQSL